MANSITPCERFITLDEVAAMVRFYSIRQLRRFESEGVMPSRRRIGPRGRKLFFVESEVRDWMRTLPCIRPPSAAA